MQDWGGWWSWGKVLREAAAKPFVVAGLRAVRGRPCQPIEASGQSPKEAPLSQVCTAPPRDGGLVSLWVGFWPLDAVGRAPPAQLHGHHRDTH